MRKLQLDFQRGSRTKLLPGWLLLMAALVLAGWEVKHDAALTGRVDALDGHVDRLRRLVDRSQHMKHADAAGAGASLRRYLAAYGRKAWDARFAAFEHAADQNVTLLTMVPRREGIVVTGEAKQLDSALAYMRRLQKSPVLSFVQLTDTEIATDRPQRPLRFTLSAQWRGAGN